VIGGNAYYFASGKIVPPDCTRAIAYGNCAAWFQAAASLGARNGIVAESPQEAHGRFRGLAAESPVFLGARSVPKKMRSIFLVKFFA
jgi:hypothetical protein